MNILITGGSGLIGQHLSRLLQQNGHRVSWLVRKPVAGPIPSYRWSPDQSYVDESAFRENEVLIHLAGENVGQSRWTGKRKQQILESRTKGTQLLTETLSRIQHSIKTVICASATGYYGNSTDKLFTETSEAGNDFLAVVTQQWESAAKGFEIPGVRVVTFRIGVVLSKDGGAIPQLIRPIKWFIGAPIGSGRQILSWIHIDDLCNMFFKAITDQGIKGIYNAVAPAPADNATITRLIARILHRPLILPPVPGFVLKLLLGEMSVIVTDGAKVSSEKIQQTGFKFMFPQAEEALKDILC